MKWSLFFNQEDYVKKSVAKEFGPLMELSLFSIDLSRHRFLKYAHMLLYFVFNACLIPVAIAETVILRTELFYFSQALHYTLLALFAVFITVNMNVQNDRVYVFHKLWALGLYDYGEPSRSEFKALEKEILQERKLLILLPFGIFLIGLFLFFALFIDDWIGGTARTYVNGVNVRLAIPFLLPFESHEGLAYYSISLILFIEIVFTVAAIGGAGFWYTVGSQRLLLHLKMLRWSVEHINDRAEELYQILHPKEVVDNPRSLQTCLIICLKKNIAHFQRIRSYHVLFNKQIGSPMVLFAFVVGTIVIALSMVILNEERSLTVGNMMSFVALGVAEVSNMLLICSYGERISTQCHGLIDDLYSISWYDNSEEFKKILRIFKSVAREPLTFKAGGLIDVNFNTFSSIMNSAYSYCNVLNASKNKSK